MMEDKDYKVIAVSPEPAKEYYNQKFGSTTYYRDVKVADMDGNEHPKPVNVGKKSADAFQVGMELYGHILVEQSFPTDKFKAGNKQQGSFGGGFQKPAANPYSGSAKPAYKDNSDGMRQGMCFNNAASYVSTLVTMAKKPIPADEWAQEVYNYANALYKLGDLGGETPNPKVPVPQTGQSKPWQVNTKDPKAKIWPSDKEDAEAQSLYNSIAQAESVPHSDLPEGF